MRFRYGKTLLVSAFFPLALALSAASASAQFVIGGWNTTRGGIFAFYNGSSATTIDAAVNGSIANVQLSGTDTLTSLYLSTVNVCVIGSPSGNFTATTSLSADEQTALLNFVKGGGGALIFVDNDSFAGSSTASVNNSYISPFGLDDTGTIDGSQNSTIANPSASPVTNGPFGSVPNWQGLYTGYFDQLGANATSLATWDANGQSSLAVIAPGALGAGSGAVVFFSDNGPLADGVVTTNDVNLVLNALAFEGATPVPAPSALLTALLGVVPGVGLAWRRRRRFLDFHAKTL